MNIFLDDIVEIFFTGLLPFLRISALLVAAPLVSLQVVSVRIRAVLAFALTVVVYPQLELPAIDPLSAGGLVLILGEILVGLIFATVLIVVNAALVTAGQSMSMSMGLGMAQTVDPNAGQVPVLSSFFAIGGHLMLFQLIIESFHAIPLGSDLNIAALSLRVVSWGGMVFLGAVLVAIPLMLSMLLVNLCIGVITRAAPALNIFAVGFPAMIIVGYVLLLIYLVNVGTRVEWLWLEAFQQTQTIWD
jgi:flagellar biosynthetic protein FliR